METQLAVTRYPRGMASLTEGNSRTDFVPEYFLRELRSAARKGDFSLVSTLLNDYEAKFSKDAFYAESLSWVARRAMSNGFNKEALAFAHDAYDLACSKIGEEPVIAGSHLALAIGASIEVQSQALIEAGKTAEAVELLEEQLARFEAQPFRIRLRKNLNALTLVGQRPPALDWELLPGSAPARNDVLQGPCLLFFWAHWCSDSRTQGRTLARMKELFKDLPVVAPTRLFGYITKGNSVPEADEIEHIREVRKVDYPVLADIPLPCSLSNFDHFGASTIPTMVGVGRNGKVAFFHPGTLSQEDLESRLRAMLL